MSDDLHASLVSTSTPMVLMEVAGEESVEMTQKAKRKKYKRLIINELSLNQCFGLETSKLFPDSTSD